MSNFTNDELKRLMSSMKEQEAILKALPTLILSEYSQDRVLDALINNITLQTLILKKQLNHESNNQN
jgi:hypothetical protein